MKFPFPDDKGHNASFSHSVSITDSNRQSRSSGEEVKEKIAPAFEVQQKLRQNGPENR